MGTCHPTTARVSAQWQQQEMSAHLRPTTPSLMVTGWNKTASAPTRKEHANETEMIARKSKNEAGEEGSEGKGGERHPTFDLGDDGEVQISAQRVGDDREAHVHADGARLELGRQHGLRIAGQRTRQSAKRQSERITHSQVQQGHMHRHFESPQSTNNEQARAMGTERQRHVPPPPAGSGRSPRRR